MSTKEIALEIQAYLKQKQTECVEGKLFDVKVVLQHLFEIKSKSQEDKNECVSIMYHINRIQDFTNTPRKRAHWLWKMSVICHILECWCVGSSSTEIHLMLFNIIRHFFVICNEYLNNTTLTKLLLNEFVSCCTSVTPGCIKDKEQLYVFTNSAQSSQTSWAYITNLVKEKCVILGSDYDSLVTQWEKQCTNVSFIDYYHCGIIVIGKQ